MIFQTRRQFVRGLGGAAVSLAGLTLVGGCGRGPAAPALAESPPETTTFRIARSLTAPARGDCETPKYIAEDFLRDEGFTDVQYTDPMGGLARQKAVSSGQAHLTLPFVFTHIVGVDAGDRIVSLAPVHAGCFELYATDQVQGIRGLKGKTVGVVELGGAGHSFVASMAAYVGMDPSRDISWAVPMTGAEALQLFAAGTIDAYAAFPPGSYDFRASGMGHVVVNSMRDRPWSQYFCCSVTMNRAFVQSYPVATKRAVRAVLQASDFCAREPERAARILVDRFPDGADYARELQTLQEVPYGHWREFDPDDTMRFYSLRLREAGMIQGSPQEMIARGADWSFFNTLKKELQPAAAGTTFVCSLSGKSWSVDV